MLISSAVMTAGPRVLLYRHSSYNTDPVNVVQHGQAKCFTSLPSSSSISWWQQLLLDL